jgi:hypothetical protein
MANPLLRQSFENVDMAASYELAAQGCYAPFELGHEGTANVLGIAQNDLEVEALGKR